MFTGWCFQSQLVLPGTNRHQNKPIFIFFYVFEWCYFRILYFRVQTGTTTNLFNRRFSCLCLLGGAFNRNLYFRVQTGTKNKPSFSCLCLLSGALSLILYYRVQTGTTTNLILSVYVYGVVLIVATCTFVYKPAPKQTYF